MSFVTDANISDKVTGEESFVSGVDVKEPAAYTPKKYYCTNCRQSIHNEFYGDIVCRRRGCKCKCQTHYVGRDGRPRPYGVADDSKTEMPEKDRKLDHFIEKINKQWNAVHPQQKPVKKESA